MILLDTDVLIIDLRYLRDARFAANRRFLDHCQLHRLPLAITCQTLLEVVGKFSFNVAAPISPSLPIKSPGATVYPSCRIRSKFPNLPPARWRRF